MQIRPNVGRQGREPSRCGSGRELRFERAGRCGVVGQLADERVGDGGLEDGEDGWVREDGGEAVRDGLETGARGGVGGEGCYAGDGGTSGSVRHGGDMLGLGALGTYRTESSETLAWRFPFFFAAASGAASEVPTRAKRNSGLMIMLEPVSK